jgi:predicted LPLAT superfamily acyltransferase
VPVVLCIGLFRGGNRYDVHFAKLPDELRIDRGNATSSCAPQSSNLPTSWSSTCAWRRNGSTYDFWNDPAAGYDRARDDGRDGAGR